MREVGDLRAVLAELSSLILFLQLETIFVQLINCEASAVYPLALRRTRSRRRARRLVLARLMSPPGVAYRLGRTIYLALTNSCNAVSLIESRGPGFVIPPASGFCRLPEGYTPSAEEIHLAALEVATGGELGLHWN